MKKNSLNASDVKRIHLRISETAKDQGKNYNPGTPLAARLSIPFCIALAVSEKKVSLGQFTEEKLKDPSIREFMKKVEVDDDRSLNERYPGTLASITEIETVNKGRLRQEVIYPKGNPKNPMSKDEVTQKFRELCSLTLPSEKYEELLSLLFGLERVSDLGQVIALLKA
jgi:2-methylcitrate dehydratase PrpD